MEPPSALSKQQEIIGCTQQPYGSRNKILSSKPNPVLPRLAPKIRRTNNGAMLALCLVFFMRREESMTQVIKKSQEKYDSCHISI